jgi:O-antigen ligase
MPRLLLRPGDLWSVEASFVLFLVSGRYKTLSELKDFPVDFTVVFLALTASMITLGIVSGRLRFRYLSLPVLVMVLFTEYAVASLFWSSFQALNVDKALRFAALTSTGFFVAYFIAQDPPRRERFLRVLVWFSLALTLYYCYYEYILGIDIVKPLDKPNYQEYGEHAAILFIAFLTLAVFGSFGELCLAVLGCSATLWALAAIGGRGALAFAVMAVPLVASGLVLRSRESLGRLARLAILLGLLAVTCTVGLLAASANGPNADISQLRTISRFDAQLSRNDTSSMDERARAQQEALGKWLLKPIFGWGIGEFWVEENYLKYPHNLPLEILMELGIVGAFLFFGAVGTGLAACLRLAGDPSTGWAEAAIALLFLTQLASHLTVAGYLADDRIFVAYMGLVIGCTSFGKKSAWPPPATAHPVERQQWRRPVRGREPVEATRWGLR